MTTTVSDSDPMTSPTAAHGDVLKGLTGLKKQISKLRGRAASVGQEDLESSEESEVGARRAKFNKTIGGLDPSARLAPSASFDSLKNLAKAHGDGVSKRKFQTETETRQSSEGESTEHAPYDTSATGVGSKSSVASVTLPKRAASVIRREGMVINPAGAGLSRNGSVMTSRTMSVTTADAEDYEIETSRAMRKARSRDKLRDMDETVMMEESEEPKDETDGTMTPRAREEESEEVDAGNAHPLPPKLMPRNPLRNSKDALKDTLKGSTSQEQSEVEDERATSSGFKMFGLGLKNGRRERSDSGGSIKGLVRNLSNGGLRLGHNNSSTSVVAASGQTPASVAAAAAAALMEKEAADHRVPSTSVQDAIASPKGKFGDLMNTLKRNVSGGKRSASNAKVVRKTIIYTKVALPKLPTSPVPPETPTSNATEESVWTSSHSKSDFEVTQQVTIKTSLRRAVTETATLQNAAATGRRWYLTPLEDTPTQPQSEYPEEDTINEPSSPTQSQSTHRSTDYNADSIYDLYGDSDSRSVRSSQDDESIVDEDQQKQARDMAVARLEGLEVRELSDGSVVWGVVSREGDRRSFVAGDENYQEEYSDEDEDEIEERVLKMFHSNSSGTRTAIEWDTPNGSEDRSSTSSSSSLAPPDFHHPPVPRRSPRRAKHISTVSSTATGTTTSVYYAPNMSLPGLLQEMMGKSRADADDYEEEDDFAVGSTVEEKLDEVMRALGVNQ